MTDERRILILGSSNAFHSFTPDEPNLSPLTEEELRKRNSGINWKVPAESLFFAPNTRDRAMTMVERHHPDAVILAVDGYQIAHERAAFRVRNRFPFLYKPWTWAGKTLFKLAGGRNRKKGSLREWIFRGPKLVSQVIVGAEPELDQHVATSYILETMQSLLDRKVPFIVRLPMLTFQPDSSSWLRTKIYNRLTARYQAYNEPIIEFCLQHDIPYYDPRTELETTGPGALIGPDRLHLTLPARRYDAQLMAERVLDALEQPEEATPTA